MRVQAKENFRDFITDGRRHQGIEPNSEYLVLGITNDEYRIWDGDAEPILYPKELFDVLDTKLPSGWMFVEYEDQEYHLDPGIVSRPGFYEDYFFSNGDVNAQAQARASLLAALEEMKTSLGKEDQPLVQEAIASLIKIIESKENLRIPKFLNK